MSVDILGTSCVQCRVMVQYSFTSTETRRLVRTDSPWLSHSSWTTSSSAHRKHQFNSFTAMTPFDNNQWKWEIKDPLAFLFFFRSSIWKDFTKMHTIKIIFVIGPENILFAGLFALFPTLEILQAGAEKGLKVFIVFLHTKKPGLNTPKVQRKKSSVN